jgi:2-polyprenyl-3-methyl-5-hydroxy-6-metoxy-1,4-benzoquinol methylase
MVHYHKCPLCSSENISLHLKTADYFLSREEFNLFKCDGCGFIFTQDHPDDADIGRYYESDEYLSHSETKSGLLSRLYGLSRRIMLGRKVKIVSKLSGLIKGSILDVGSGTGHFLNAMQKAGWDVRGVEINEKARQYSISEFGLEILDPGKLQTLEPGSFDCITLWHVLEHFQDPFNYSREILRLLKPGGSCITAIPNSGSYDAEYYNKLWAAYDVPRHLWHFTPDTFKKFAEKSGFEVKEIRPLPLDVFYISILSEKYKGANLLFLSGVIKGLWFSILSLFNKQRSSSLIYSICKSDT